VRCWCIFPLAPALRSTDSAASAVLNRAGVRLGQNYPLPIVDLDRARKAALDGYGKVRSARN
jgi:deoxyribodipyrimidine photo-lyase